MDRGAGRAVVHALALDRHIVFRVLAVQGEIPCRLPDRVEHQRARETDAAVIAIGGAGLGQRLDAGGDGIGEADGLQERQHRLVDAFLIVALQRSVAAALKAGTYRLYVVSERRCPHGATRFASTGAARALIRRRFLLFKNH